MAANRKFLQIAGSTLAKIQALSGENAVKEREILLAVDTGTLIVGTGSGAFKQIGSVPKGTSAQRTATSPVDGQLYLDTTEVMLYRGNGTEWEKCVDVIPTVKTPTAGNLVKVKADGTLEDAGHAEADVQFKLTSSTENNVLVADANGFMVDSGTAIADVQKKVASATNGDLAGLDANGFVTDSGVLAADVQTKLTTKVADNLLSVKADGFMEDSGIAKADVQTKLTSGNFADGNILKVTATGFMADSGFKFNDSGTGANDVWSAQKVTDAITSAIAGMSWQSPVKEFTTAPNGTPAAGDRFLVKATATGDFTGKEGTIAEYDGTEWKFTNPVDGMAVFIENTDHQMAYNGTAWVDISSAFTYTAGNGVDITNNTISAVVKANSGLALDSNGLSADLDATSVVIDANGKISLKVKSNDALNVDATNGVNVRIDNSSIVLNDSYQLSVKDVDFGTW